MKPLTALCYYSHELDRYEWVETYETEPEIELLMYDEDIGDYFSYTLVNEVPLTHFIGE